MTLIGEPEIRSEARGELVRYTSAAGDSARAQLLATQLLKDQPNYLWSKLVAAHYSNSWLLRTGNEFPVFSLPPLPDTSGKRITNSVLHARFTLVDFWGTWCGPCISELPALAKLYATYHPTGLEILSIAADAEPATVNDFQRNRYPMPWLNALGGATDSPVLQHLGVVGYPTVVLVDSAGTIVASGNRPICRLSCVDSRAVYVQEVRRICGADMTYGAPRIVRSRANTLRAQTHQRTDGASRISMTNYAVIIAMAARSE